jgi:hypothetical protein
MVSGTIEKREQIVLCLVLVMKRLLWWRVEAAEKVKDDRWFDHRIILKKFELSCVFEKNLVWSLYDFKPGTC